MVGDNGAGFGRPLVAGDVFVGHSVSKVDNSLVATAGAKNIQLRNGRYRLDVALVGLITDVGQPVYASDDAVLTFSAPSNSFVGVISRYVSATRMEVEFRPGEVDEFGPDQNRDLKSASYTTDAQDAGKIIYVDTDSVVITLDGTIAGHRIRIVNAAGLGVSGVVVDPNAADILMGGCDLAAGGAVGDAMTNTKETAQRGDYVELLSDGSTGWTIVGLRGIWTVADSS
jgi:predicted ribosome-associated RNA-binding protein Tma20